MNQEKKELVLYRLARASEALDEARVLLGASHVHGAVNRLYYACFYGASALLLAKGFSSPKHSGIRSLFHQKIVKAGHVDISLGKFYDRLFDCRQKSDYADLTVFQVEDVKAWVKEAEAFVEAVEVLARREIER